MTSVRARERRSDHRRTTVLLIRHGHTDALGSRLVSRLPGYSLNATGRAAVARLRAVLSAQPLAAVYASPLKRTMETATPLAADRGVPVRACDGLLEVDFGEWSGKTFAELDRRKDWRQFNNRRGSAPVPGGESAAAVQVRILACLQDLHRRHPGETIAAVSHADVIRAALLHFTATPLDRWQHIEVAPASITALAIDARNGEVLYHNMCPA